MTVEEMPKDRLLETLLALRKAARDRDSFAHLPMYGKHFVRGILERRRLLRRIDAPPTNG